MIHEPALKFWSKSNDLWSMLKSHLNNDLQTTFGRFNSGWILVWTCLSIHTKFLDSSRLISIKILKSFIECMTFVIINNNNKTSLKCFFLFKLKNSSYSALPDLHVILCLVALFYLHLWLFFSQTQALCFGAVTRECSSADVRDGRDKSIRMIACWLAPGGKDGWRIWLSVLVLHYNGDEFTSSH